jgi:hypothetical protein
LPERVTFSGRAAAVPERSEDEIARILRDAGFDFHIVMEHEGRECALVACFRERCPAFIPLVDVHPGMPRCDHSWASRRISEI